MAKKPFNYDAFFATKGEAKLPNDEAVAALKKRFTEVKEYTNVNDFISYFGDTLPNGKKVPNRLALIRKDQASKSDY